MKRIVFMLIAASIIGGAGYFVYIKSQNNATTAQISIESDNKEGKAVEDITCKDCNVIMISLSNVSAEHMSLYGYERLTTPKLDAWAKDAIVFNNAFTQSSWTLPVGVSLFTSLYPYAHGVTDRYENNVLSENIKTLPEILRENGYATAAFTGGLDYSKTFGHMRGFDTVIEEGDNTEWPTDFAGFKTAFSKAKRWMEGEAKDKFFLFLHAYDAHCPFLPPQEFAGVFSAKNKDITIDSSLCLRGYRNNKEGEYKASYFKNGQQEVTLTQNDIDFLRDSYDEEILSVDDLVADFLESIDGSVLDKTIVVIFSDHGEMFAKHGRFGRAGAIRGTLYDDVLHIPLMVKIPHEEGLRMDELVQVIDIMPTLMNLLHIRSETIAQGRDLMSVIGGVQHGNEFVFSGSEFNVGMVSSIYRKKSVNEAVRNHDWKLIHEIILSDVGSIENETFELYNIKNDTDELYNVIGDQTEVAEELKVVLNEWMRESKKITNSRKTEEVPDVLIEEARKRGYW